MPTIMAEQNNPKLLLGWRGGVVERFKARGWGPEGRVDRN
jgi:hypothetical protein